MRYGVMIGSEYEKAVLEVVDNVNNISAPALEEIISRNAHNIVFLVGLVNELIGCGIKSPTEIADGFIEVAPFLEDETHPRIKHFVGIALRRNKAKVVRELIQARFPDGDLTSLELSSDDGERFIIFSADPSNKGMLRVTRFSKDGFVGHSEYQTYVKALNDAIYDGYRTMAEGSLDEIAKLESFNLGNEFAKKVQLVNKGKMTFAEMMSNKG